MPSTPIARAGPSTFNASDMLKGFATTATLALLLAVPLRGQVAFGTLSTCGHPAPGLGAIRGRLIADARDVEVARGDFANGGECMVRSADNGIYILSGMRPGKYGISVSDMGVRYVKPITVQVVADRETALDFHLQPENLVLDCLDDRACQRLLAPLDSSHASALNDDEELL